MPLRDYIDREIVACSPDDSIQTVAHIMKENDVGAVLVTEEGIPRGILTDRDLVVRCIAEENDCEVTLARDVMSRSVETISVDDGIYSVVKKMKEGGVRRLPVVDDDGKAVGLLSFEDIFDLIAVEVGALRDAVQPVRRIKIRNRTAA